MVETGFLNLFNLNGVALKLKNFGYATTFYRTVIFSFIVL